jgi:hypothetical protein
MRRIALGALAALLLLAVTAQAADDRTTVDIDAHVTPAVRKFQPKTTPSTLAINLKFDGPGEDSANTLQQAILKFTYGAKLNGSLFPSCSAQDIRDHKPCPKGSRIGSGTALGILGENPDNAIREPITVDLYNGPKGKSITFRIRGEQPAVIDVPFDAPFKFFTTGDYNYQLTVDVPELLQVIVGIPVSLDFFNVKVGASRMVKGKKRGYIETLICPPKARVILQADFKFLESPSYHTDTFIQCG